jgi:hypothetical protein
VANRMRTGLVLKPHSLKARVHIPVQGPVALHTFSQEKTLSGISSALYSQLRDTLMDCGPFESNAQLKAVFAAPKLKPWRNSVPEAPTRIDRVDRTIYELAERRNVHGENALALFLQASSEKHDVDTECYHRLASLAEDIERALAGAQPVDQTTPSTEPVVSDHSPTPTAETIAEVERLVQEDQLAEALAQLAGVEAYRREVASLMQRLNRIRKRERKGTVDRTEVDAEYNRIAEAIIDLVLP